MKQRLQSLFRFMRRNRAMTKIISFALSLILVFYVIPSTIYTKAAELLDGSDEPICEVDTSSNSAGSVSTLQPTGVLFEDVSLREESVKHFHLEDGTYLAAQYNYPVHTKDSSGEWQDIDNALSESGSEFSNSNARIKFAKKINGSSELFTLHDGNTKLTLTLVDAKKGVVGEVTNNSDAEADTKLQKMMNLEKLSASVIYRDILDGVDLEYVAYSMNVKENIIVKEKKDSYTYSFEFKLNGLTPTLTENGDIEIREDGADEIKYLIPAPVVFDANGEHAPSAASAYTLTHENGKKYILTVTVDSAWMNDEQRAFPVTVDPAVTTSNSSVIDVNIATSYPTTTSSSSTDLTVMNSSHTMLIHWKMVTLPTIPSSARIIDANVMLQLRSGYGAYVGAYEVLKDWDATLTWEKYEDTSNPQGSTLTHLVDYKQLTFAGAYGWTVTELAKEWYRGNNFGVAFGILPLGSVTSATFYSSETEYKPALTVVYRDMKGLESYWPYSSHSVGIAGNGSINLANGNLVFTIPTLTATDSIFSFTPTLVYDASMSGKAYYDQTSEVGVTSPFLGYGFKLNMNETLRCYSDDDVTVYYVYSDADGTEHYFFEDEETGVHIDEDGLGLTLTKDSSGNITIASESGGIRFFEKVSHSDFGTRWRLSYYQDIYGNRLVYSYMQIYYDLFKPTKVSLLPNGHTTAIDLLEFRYHSTTGKLTMVYNPSAKIAAVMRYSSTYNGDIVSSGYMYLRQIDYAYGSSSVTTANWDAFALNETALTNITIYDSAKYNYNSSGKLIEAINVKSNSSVKYTYFSSMLDTVTEYGNSKPGNSFYVDVYNNYSVIQTNGNDGDLGTVDDICTVYVLDHKGRCISVYTTSQDGEAVYGASADYAYDSQYKSINNIKQEAIINGSAVNYIVNGSFENVSGAVPTYWTVSGNAYSTSSIPSSGGSFTKSVLLRPYADSTASISQDLALKSDQYTLSMPISFSYCEGVTGTVKVLEYGTTNTIHSEDITPLLSSGEIFFSTTFTVPTASSYKNVTVEISFTSPETVSTLPMIQIDSVMLSRTIGAEKFNLLEYGSFEHTVLGSAGNGMTIPSSYWSNESGNAASVYETYEDEGKCLLLYNSTGGTKYAKQTIYSASSTKLNECDTNGAAAEDNTPHIFAVSGFAKASNAVPGRPFRLKAEIVYYCGANATDITSVYYYDFNAENEGWQYTSGIFTLGYEQNGEKIDTYLCVKSITIYCDVSNHYGVAASFNDLSVTYAGVDSVTNYTYTENGKVASAISGIHGSFYEYNEDGNVYRTANNEGVILEYVYDSIVTDRVNEVKEYEFTYNGDNDFPYTLDNPFDAVTKTPKTEKVFVYDAYGLITNESTYAYNSSGMLDYSMPYVYNYYVYDTTEGSKIFGTLLKQTDTTGVTIKNYYDSNNGNLLASVNTGSNIGTSYVYDGAGRLTNVYPASYVSSTGSYSSATNIETVGYTYNSNNRLSEIATDSTTYVLLYDDYGNNSEIKIGDTAIATYVYGNRNGKLSQINYGNGHIVKYVYNDLEILTEIWYNDDTEPAYEYKYTSDCKLAMIIDNIYGTITAYKYDNEGKVIETVVYDAETYEEELSKEITYDEESRITKIEHFLEYPLISGTSSVQTRQHYLYNDDGTLYFKSFYSDLVYAGSEYEYDNYDRVSSIETQFASGAGHSFYQTVDLTYVTKNSHATTLVENYTNYIGNVQTNSYTLTYDSNNNISRIQYSDGRAIRYGYDNLGQLTMEHKEWENYATVYLYDDAGNMYGYVLYTVNADGSLGEDISPNISHSYFNSEWGDQLSSFWGNTITYDEIGNPTSYYNGEYMYFGWEGRTMTSASTVTTDYVFTYYENGLRKTKTDVQGIMSYEYVYDGTTLVMETFVDLYTILYIYDANGSPIGFRCREVDYASGVWDVYWYEKNPFGDIVAIYSSTGQKLISYEYDPWGNFTTTNHTDASTTARYNSLKYRGYYYDDDFNMYYLQSRYYDPATCRFISPDSLMSGVNGSLHGFNLYAYCFNNPLSYTDSQGNWPKWMEDAYEWVENKRDEAKEVWNEVTEWVENKVSEIGAGSAGVSLSFTYDHVLVNVQVGIAKDRQGNKDLQISISSGSTSAAYGLFIGGYSTITNAPSVDKLTGDYSQVGGSLGSSAYGLPVAGGVDVIKMNDTDENDIYHGLSFSGGFGTPGLEAHMGVGTTFSYTDVVDTYNQVIKFFDDLR